MIGEKQGKERRPWNIRITLERLCPEGIKNFKIGRENTKRVWGEG